MNITEEQLIDCITIAKTELEVHVPSKDYYACRDDFDTETIYYIDANRLIGALRDLGEPEPVKQPKSEESYSTAMALDPCMTCTTPHHCGVFGCTPKPAKRSKKTDAAFASCEFCTTPNQCVVSRCAHKPVKMEETK